MKALTHRASLKPLLLVAILILPFAGCGGHWDMSWDESGRGCRGGYGEIGGGGHMQNGDAFGAVIFIGIVGIAWGIQEIAEAISGH